MFVSYGVAFCIGPWSIRLPVKRPERKTDVEKKEQTAISNEPASFAGYCIAFSVLQSACSAQIGGVLHDGLLQSRPAPVSGPLSITPSIQRHRQLFCEHCSVAAGFQ